MRYRATVGDELTVGFALSHQINEHLSVKLSDSIKPLHAWNNKSADSYNFGVAFDFEFKN